ncbi:MAG: hypothetical protein WCI57_03185 [Candidatus Berkelbacteria bacterium]
MVKHYFSKIAKILFKEYLIFFIAGLVVLLWFKKDSLVWGVDTIMPLNLKNFLSEYYHTWTWRVAYSAADGSKFPFWMPLGAILAAIEYLKISFSVIAFEKILVYAIFSFSGFSAWFLFRELFPKTQKIAQIGAGLFYMFNLYSLIMWVAFSWIIFFYAFFPLVLALIIRGLRSNKNFVYFAWLAFVWTILLGPSNVTPPFVITSWAVVGMFAIYEYFNTKDREKRKSVIKNILLLFVSWAALNLYWMVPQLLSLKSEFARRSVSGNPLDLVNYNSTSLDRIFRFTGPNFLQESYKNVQFYPWFDVYNRKRMLLLGLSISLFIFLPFLTNLKKNSKLYIFIVSIFLFFIFLVSGLKSPIPILSKIIYSIPYLAPMFRSVWQRFMPLLVLFSSILLAYSLDKTFVYLQMKFKKLIVSIAVSLAIIFLIVGVYAFPFFTDQVYPERSGVIVSSKIKIPSSYYDASAWLDKQPEDFNVLPLPLSTMGIAALSWNDGLDGYLGSYPLLNMSSKRFIVTDFGSGRGTKLAKSIYSGSVDSVDGLTDYNVKFVIVHKDVNFDYIKNNDWYVGYKDNQAIATSIQKIQDLKLVESFGNLDIYENLKWSQKHFYVEATKGNPTIEVEKVNPAEYKVKIHNLNGSLNLVFNEIYNKDIALYPVNEQKQITCSFLDKLTDKNTECSNGDKYNLIGQLSYLGQKGVSPESDVDNPPFLNSWKVDSNEIMASNSQEYTKNSDGTIDVEYVIHHKIQSYFYLAVLLSSLSLIVIILITILSYRRTRSNES